MKMQFSKWVYDQFDDESVADGKAKDECDLCDGGGVIYEYELSPEDAAAIQENLRRQGVPIAGN
jgi:hypothetical protein